MNCIKSRGVSSAPAPVLTISIVSHGQAGLVFPLLEQLSALAQRLPVQVILTENFASDCTARRLAIPERGGRPIATEGLWIDYIVNPAPRGFGANHNAAFTRAQAPFFCVMNPDIRLLGSPLEPLLRQLRAAPGVAGPRVLNSNGRLEDSVRRVPTPGRLLKRHLKNIRTADYEADRNRSVDWMAGMCLMFDTAAYRDLRGFDERFFLYCEDVDICLRAHLAGWSVSWVVEAAVEHEAQRKSWRKPRYLWWHLQSYARLFGSPSYRAFVSRQNNHPAEKRGAFI